jgi:serine phosphatase RsbU (regulator of sigma subunit)
MTDEEKTVSQRPTFLVVDDDPMVRKLVARGLKTLRPEKIIEVEDGLEAKQVLGEQVVDVVVTDVLMPNMDGRELMKWAQEHHPGPIWIVLSGLDTFDAAVDALHLGAFDFLAKPPEVNRVRVAVRNALEQIQLVRDRKRLHEELESSHDQLAAKVQQLEGLCRMLEDQAQVIRNDLARAEVIQRALLPQIPPEMGQWCVETLYRPGSNVGGDYYDVVSLDDQHLGVVIGDAAGHGVAAAMLSVLFKHRLELLDRSSRPLEPKEVLAAVNNDLYADMSAPGMFITAVYVLINKQSGHMRIASAGHPPVVCACRSGKSHMVSRGGPALGLQADARYEQEEIDFDLGDRLLLYTDGVSESSSSVLSTDILIESLLETGSERDRILKGFYEISTADVGDDRDDITIILLERNAGKSHFDTLDEKSGEKKTASAPTSQVQILQGMVGNHGFMSIAGNATWMRSTLFFEVARRQLAQCDELTIDLHQCEYMDSAFLGTLHEIVVTKPEIVRLQKVGPNILALFDELDMHAVLDRINPSAVDLPAPMEPIRRSEHDLAEQGLRVLRAHEILASLSAENQEQFRGVVESLRADLQSSGGS